MWWTLFFGTADARELKLVRMMMRSVSGNHWPFPRTIWVLHPISGSQVLAMWTCSQCGAPLGLELSCTLLWKSRTPEGLSEILRIEPPPEGIISYFEGLPLIRPCWRSRNLSRVRRCAQLYIIKYKVVCYFITLVSHYFLPSQGFKT